MAPRSFSFRRIYRAVHKRQADADPASLLPWQTTNSPAHRRSGCPAVASSALPPPPASDYPARCCALCPASVQSLERSFRHHRTVAFAIFFYSQPSLCLHRASLVQQVLHAKVADPDVVSLTSSSWLDIDLNRGRLHSGMLITSSRNPWPDKVGIYTKETRVSALLPNSFSLR